MLLNDGPQSQPNPAISFMVVSETAADTEKYWQQLMDGGSVLMPLNSYPWSEKYGWVKDKFGVSWQVYTGAMNNKGQNFCPTLMFTGNVAGKTAEAVHFYTGLFPQSAIMAIFNYVEGDGDKPEFIKHSQFAINDLLMGAMDSSGPHGFGFTDAVSLVVECEDQEEIDKYWHALTSNGGVEVACGWLTDQFGISWQIIPKNLGQLISRPERGQRAMAALMKMKKLIITDLENA